MSRARFTRTWSPRHLRQVAVKLDNIALVPASELASLKQWQDRARRLPAGNTLVVVPNDNLRLRQIGHKICSSLKHRGRRSIVAVTRSHHLPN